METEEGKKMRALGCKSGEICCASNDSSSLSLSPGLIPGGVFLALPDKRLFDAARASGKNRDFGCEFPFVPGHPLDKH